MLLDNRVCELLVLGFVVREVPLDLLEVALLLILILLGSGRLLLRFVGSYGLQIFKIILIIKRSRPSRHCRYLELRRLGLLGIRNEIDVLISLGEVEQVKVALNLLSLVLLNHALKADQSNVLVGFKLPLLLLFLASLGQGVMLAILDRRVYHLVIELIRVALSGLLAELLCRKCKAKQSLLITFSLEWKSLDLRL